MSSIHVIPLTVEEARRLCFKYVRAKVYNYTVAEDLAQVAFLKYMVSEGSSRNYLRKVCGTIIADHFRENWSKEVVVGDLVALVDKRCLLREVERKVDNESMLSNFSLTNQRIFRDIAVGESAQESADGLGISIHALKSKIYQNRRQARLIRECER